MKYYFFMALFASALNSMEAPLDPMGSPPSSPAFHSAPNSPEVRRYDCAQLLALRQPANKCTLSASMDTAIKSVRVQIVADVDRAKSRENHNRRHHAKK
jgi:hypothetical protein